MCNRKRWFKVLTVQTGLFLSFQVFRHSSLPNISQHLPSHSLRRCSPSIETWPIFEVTTITRRRRRKIFAFSEAWTPRRRRAETRKHHGFWGCLLGRNWWLSMVINGYRWLSMVINGYWWLSIFIDGYQWLSMVIDGYQWLSIVINGYQWLSMVIMQWLSVVINGYQ